MKIYREITPLSSLDVFVLSHYEDPKFNYPLHNHPEYEICLTLNSSGNRIIGDSLAKYSVKDLVLVGPYIYHRWDNADQTEEQRTKASTMVIQFGKELFDSSLLEKEVFYPIRRMLYRSTRGILFKEGKSLDTLIDSLIDLSKLSGFEATLKFLSILNNMATNPNQELLTSPGFKVNVKELNGNRISEVYDFIINNYTNRIMVTDAAEIANMSESAFSHFFKKCTNKSFTKFVVELRIGLACKLLMETQDTISQICFKCGFNNISNFNRLFKKYKQFTPFQYRQKLEIALFSTDKFEYHFPDKG